MHKLGLRGNVCSALKSVKMLTEYQGVVSWLQHTGANTNIGSGTYKELWLYW